MSHEYDDGTVAAEKANEGAKLININSQCADIENWDDKAFPLMIERAVPDALKPMFTTLSVESADILVALLSKPLTILLPTGLTKFPAITDDHPDLAPLVDWLRGASASVKSRRSRRST